MPKVNISLNGRSYAISCDEGQEARVLELGGIIDKKMREIAKSGAARSESYLLVLTALVLTDELLGEDNVLDIQKQERQKEIDIKAVSHLTARIETLAEKIAS